MTLRVLFATDHIHFPQGGGGAERNTHELCLALRGQDVLPAVSCSLRADRSWLSWRNRILRKLPPGHEFVADQVCGYPVFRGWRQDRVGEMVSRFRPDAVVVQSSHPDGLLRALAPSGVPVAVYFHEVEEIDHLAALAGAGLTVLANSDFTAARLLQVCGLRCRVVLPLIDPRQYRVATNPERVLFVNTVPRKGLEIAFGLAERRPDIPFDFVLSWILGPEQVAQLNARARATGNIVLHTPTRDMRPLYARAKIVLAPSQWEEAWGRVATEAHVNGIPVLGSDRGGLPQAIGQGGLVVPAQAPIEAWLAALDLIWNDPDIYAARARTYATRPEIQPETIVGELKRILQATAARRGTQPNE
jgi:glycosyltransferase involved in cell wall biosynthesis